MAGLFIKSIFFPMSIDRLLRKKIPNVPQFLGSYLLDY